jgi:hypothetical protein
LALFSKMGNAHGLPEEGTLAPLLQKLKRDFREGEFDLDLVLQVRSALDNLFDKRRALEDKHSIWPEDFDVQAIGKIMQTAALCFPHFEDVTIDTFATSALGNFLVSEPMTTISRRMREPGADVERTNENIKGGKARFVQIVELPERRYEEDESACWFAPLVVYLLAQSILDTSNAGLTDDGHSDGQKVKTIKHILETSPAELAYTLIERSHLSLRQDRLRKDRFAPLALQRIAEMWLDDSTRSDVGINIYPIPVLLAIVQRLAKPDLAVTLRRGWLLKTSLLRALFDALDLVEDTEDDGSGYSSYDSHSLSPGQKAACDASSDLAAAICEQDFSIEVMSVALAADSLRECFFAQQPHTHRSASPARLAARVEGYILTRADAVAVCLASSAPAPETFVPGRPVSSMEEDGEDEWTCEVPIQARARLLHLHDLLQAKDARTGDGNRVAFTPEALVHARSRFEQMPRLEQQQLEFRCFAGASLKAREKHIWWRKSGWLQDDKGWLLDGEGCEVGGDDLQRQEEEMAAHRRGREIEMLSWPSLGGKTTDRIQRELRTLFSMTDQELGDWLGAHQGKEDGGRLPREGMLKKAAGVLKIEEGGAVWQQEVAREEQEREKQQKREKKQKQQEKKGRRRLKQAEGQAEQEQQQKEQEQEQKEQEQEQEQEQNEATTQGVQAREEAAVQATTHAGVSSWSKEAVGEWLCTIGVVYEQYVQAFVYEGINGEELIELSESDLVDFGVTTKRHRNRILKEIGKLATKEQATKEQAKKELEHGDLAVTLAASFAPAAAAAASAASAAAAASASAAAAAASAEMDVTVDPLAGIDADLLALPAFDDDEEAVEAGEKGEKAEDEAEDEAEEHVGLDADEQGMQEAQELLKHARVMKHHMGSVILRIESAKYRAKKLDEWKANKKERLTPAAGRNVETMVAEMQRDVVELRATCVDLEGQVREAERTVAATAATAGAGGGRSSSVQAEKRLHQLQLRLASTRDDYETKEAGIQMFSGPMAKMLSSSFLAMAQEGIDTQGARIGRRGAREGGVVVHHYVCDKNDLLDVVGEARGLEYPDADGVFSEVEYPDADGAFVFGNPTPASSFDFISGKGEGGCSTDKTEDADDDRHSDDRHWSTYLPRMSTSGGYVRVACLPTLETALDVARDGDTVCLPGGVHPADGVYDLDGEVQIVGVDARQAAVIENGAEDDFFVNVQSTPGSSSSKITLRNLTFRQQGGLEATLCVRSGEVVVEECVFEEAESEGVRVCSMAKLTMRGCKVSGVWGAGVLLECGASAHIERCEICNCGHGDPSTRGGSGVHPVGHGGVEMRLGFMGEDESPPREVTLMGNHIHDNNGFGITLVKAQQAFLIHQRANGNLSDGLPLLNTMDNRLENNSAGTQGTCTADGNDRIVARFECPY